MIFRVLPFRAAALLAASCFAPTWAEAQSSDDRYTPCGGPETALSLLPPTTDFLELSGQQRNLLFADWVRTCLHGDLVEVSGPYLAFLDCEDLRDPIDEGVGYEFTDAEGIPAELWFVVDPTSAEPVLEIGVKREGAPGYWIDTQWPICRE